MKVSGNAMRAGAIFIGAISAGVAIISTAVNDRKRIEKELQESADRIEKLESLSPDKNQQ